ncbi:MAG TPA: hypothetical protein VK658_20440 [Chryseolinea sp.]|nr:hypothetical protein [Chryseolinea sp.]
MRIDDNLLKHWIENFYGHGSWESKIWFISYEEPGADVPEDLAERLHYFEGVHGLASTQETLCDLRELYRCVAFRNDGPRAALFSNHFDYRFGPQSIVHGIWKNLIAFVHGYLNEPLPDLLTYQRQKFALSLYKREALIPLYPLPSPHNHAWYYSWIDAPGLPFLKHRAQYEVQVYQHRIRTIFQNMRTHKPGVVLMYEMNNINTLKASVQEFFPQAAFQLVKAVKGVIPQHHRANLDGTTLLITTQVPALRHNRIETGFDWGEVGKMTKTVEESGTL